MGPIMLRRQEPAGSANHRARAPEPEMSTQTWLLRIFFVFFVLGLMLAWW